MKKDWKMFIVRTNIKSNILSNLINVVALSLGVIIFALFSGFYLSQINLINENSNHFVEALSANLEKHEVVESESSFLKLKQVRRPSANEVISLLDKEIRATYDLNFSALFSSDKFTLYNNKLFPFTTVFLPDFNFNENQNSLLLKEVKEVASGEIGVYINSKMYDALLHDYAFSFETAALHYENILLNNDDEINITLSFRILGVFNELNYLSTPKLYFDQSMINGLLSNIFIEESLNLIEYLNTLPSDHVLTSYAYRLYFHSKNDMKRAINILQSLKEERVYLVLTDEHIDRLSSLNDLFNLMNIVILISGSLVVISFLFINMTITHTELKKNNAKNALLYFYGAKTIDFIDIYLTQNLFLILSSLFGLFLIPTIETYLNRFLYLYLGIENMVSTPLLVFQGIPLLLPFLIFILLFISASIIATLSICIKNQKTLVKRLAHND